MPIGSVERVLSMEAVIAVQPDLVAAVVSTAPAPVVAVPADVRRARGCPRPAHGPIPRSLPRLPCRVRSDFGAPTHAPR